MSDQLTQLKDLAAQLKSRLDVLQAGVPAILTALNAANTKIAELQAGIGTTAPDFQDAINAIQDDLNEATTVANSLPAPLPVVLPDPTPAPAPTPDPVPAPADPVPAPANGAAVPPPSDQPAS